MMTKLTWLGTEDYREGETPLESITWCGVLFTAGDKVEVTDEWMIAKARGNRFFLVQEDDVPQSGIEPSGAKSPAPSAREDGRERPDVQWREPATEADPADVSFFDDPPGVETPLDFPPDYPPEEEPKRKPGRSRSKVT
jgi:hypothetical protein